MGGSMNRLIVDNNCGTGAGGFKPGNTCASGKEIAEDATSLANKLLPGGTVSRHASYKNNLSIAYPSMTPNEANLRRLEAGSRLENLGFIQIISRDDGSSVWEHPHGHSVDVIHATNWGSRTNRLDLHTIFVPKEAREGVQVSREARDATNEITRKIFGIPNHRDGRSEDAVEQGMLGEYARARRNHEEALAWLKWLSDQDGVKTRKEDLKAIANASALHAIARDWYMEKLGVQNAADNCGTGKGGFKRGNTCASGKEVATDVGELTKVLGLTGEPQIHLDNNQSMTYRLGGLFNPNKAKAVHDNILRKALGAGFKSTSDSNHGDDLANWRTTTLEHSHGHVVNIVTQTPTRHQEGRVTTYVYYIPKEDREGLALSKEALDTTSKAFKGNPSHHEMEAEAAVEDALMRDHKGARRYHEKMIRAHTQKAGEIQVARATLGKGKVYEVDLVKLHKDAAAAHSIARDWYMERMGVQNGQWQPIGNNCGTGAGGFKPGNTCASGREVGDGTTNGAAAAIGMNKPIQLDRGVPNRVYQVFEATSKSPNDIKALKELLNSVKSLLVDNGFKAATKSGRMYEHSHGHMASISDYTNSKSLMPSFSVYFTYIPKEWREGYALTKDAHQNSLKLEDSLGPNGLLSTGLGDAEMLYGRGALTGHAGMIKLHEAAAQRAADNAKLAKAHRDAAAIHSIARDWYMDKLGIQNKAGTWNNCGTGAGGFKKGNKCARGGGVIDDTFENLREHLGVPAKATGFGKHPNVSYSLRSEIEADELRKILKSSGFALMPKRGYSIEDYDHPNGHRVTISKKDTERNYILVGVDYVPPHLQEGARLSGQAHRDSLEALQHDWGTIGIGSAADAKWAVRQGHLERAKNEHTYARDIHTREAEEMDNRGNKAAARAHRRAAESHSIARDWYMEKLGVQNRSWAKVS